MFFIKLHNTPLFLSFKKNNIKCVAYNAMGKTLLLKTLTNFWFHEIKTNKKKKNFSASQTKKLNFLINHKKIWILDEPVSDLDFYNYMYLKTILKEHINKKGKLIFTQNKMKNRNKIFYFYFSSYWI